MVTISWTSVFSGKLMAFFSFNKNIWKYFHMVSTVFQNEKEVFESQHWFSNLSNGEENFVGKHFVCFVFSTTKHLDYLLMNESRIQRTSTKYWHWILPTEYVYQFWKWYHKMHISILFFAFRYICNLCTLRFAVWMFVSTILVDLFLLLLLLLLMMFFFYHIVGMLFVDINSRLKTQIHSLVLRRPLCTRYFRTAEIQFFFRG